MKVVVSIDITNAEYDTLPEYEIARMLRLLADDAEDHGLDRMCAASGGPGEPTVMIQVFNP